MEEQVRTRLPQAFVERMQESLGAEAEAFFTSYDSPRAYGLRRNPLKLTREEFERQMPFTLTPVSWADEGYYYQENERPGKHAFHEMGLYYIQEPSAMCVAQVAQPQAGERILDLCAAPGGKSTQLAGRMHGEGLLVCNEIVPNRARILAQNIERMGIRNAVVTNHSPQELAERFAGFFDRVIVDAPCSGEGMFHKEETALTEWSPENVSMCAKRQREILSSAVDMLRAGGELVYSTCTFAPAEDEEMVQWLLTQFPELSLVPIDCVSLGISEGTLAGTGRIYPHRQRGEGHFVARLQKSGRSVLEPLPRMDTAPPAAGKKGAKANKKTAACTDVWAACEQFLQENLRVTLSGRREQFGDQLYLVPQELPELAGSRVLRAGLHLGTNKKNRFEPSHALALALTPADVRQTCETDQPLQYLRGMTLECAQTQNGWTLVTYQGQPLGWGKASRGVIKNHYPKGLRILW